jgi:hypothetical protein
MYKQEHEDDYMLSERIAPLVDDEDADAVAFFVFPAVFSLPCEPSSMGWS